MSVARTTSVCPFCKEQIQAGAVRCKHCQSDLSGAKKQKKSLFARYNNFRFGFATGVLFSVALLILVYFQFFQE